MTTTDEPTRNCPWCESVHGGRYLCDPVRAYLDGIVAHAGSFTFPDIELSEPVHIPGELGDVLLRQFVVNAGIAELGGVVRPVLVVTGRDSAGAQLPRWTFVGTLHEIQQVRDTFNRMCSIAITRARAGR